LNPAGAGNPEPGTDWFNYQYIKGEAKMATLYNVIFEGKVAPGRDLESVKKAMMNLLKMNSQGIERIFSGQPISLKNGVNIITAEKYQKAIEAAGAVCKVEPIAER
jgi:hypothetical protein